MTRFTRILVPTDFGPASERALDVALELAAKFDAKVTLLHATWIPPYAYGGPYVDGFVWPVDEIERAADKELAGAAAKAKARYRNIESLLVNGEPWQRVLDIAKDSDADLIVMGTHGRRGVAHVFLGSVAEKVVRLSPVPVLTVSAKGDPHTRDVARGDIEKAG